MVDRNGRTGRSRAQILLYLPNLVGYVRFLLLVSTFVLHGCGAHGAVFWLSLVQFGLDYVDGALARAFDQATGFGAFLDVLLDNAARGVLWICGADPPCSVLPVLLEMLVFVCTHRVVQALCFFCLEPLLQGGGPEWKTKYYVKSPRFVQMVLRNGFKTPVGIFTIAGLMGCPLWLYTRKFLPQYWWFTHVAVGVLLFMGRLTAAACECWTVLFHIGSLVEDDTKKTEED